MHHMAFLLQKINLLQPEMLSDDNDYEKVIKIYFKKMYYHFNFRPVCKLMAAKFSQRVKL